MGPPGSGLAPPKLVACLPMTSARCERDGFATHLDAVRVRNLLQPTTSTFRPPKPQKTPSPVETISTSMGGGLSLSLPPTPTASQPSLTTPRSDAPNRLSGSQVSDALSCSGRQAPASRQKRVLVPDARAQ